MADEALDKLLQTLSLILERDDVLTIPRGKERIISIRDKVSVLQLNLNRFPENEAIRDAATTTQDIVDFLFSSENLPYPGSTSNFVFSNQLRLLEEELESTAGAVVDYCKGHGSVNNVQLSDSPSSSNGLREIAQKLTSTVRYALPSAKSDKDVVVVDCEEDLSYSSEEDLSYSPTVTSSSSLAVTKKDVVGLEEDLEAIMGRLITSGSSSKEVISIVGMEGIGKTTLAKIVYDDLRVCDHFDICAWVAVHQEYRVKSFGSDLMKETPEEKGVKRDRGLEMVLKSVRLDLMKEILGKSAVQGKRNSFSDSEEIRKKLKGGRYLIVMDGVWSREVWDKVEILFPDVSNGSRVILTSRLQNVIPRVIYGGMHTHKVRFLDANQSWDLFRQKVFADQDCPPELQDVAKKIVKGCEGLPLSIVKVAELLSEKVGQLKFWEQIAAIDEKFGTSIDYESLPHHLKECFQYMAGFPQDYEIRASEIIKLWVAEGFLEPSDGQSMEDEAERCLWDLHRRSLVLDCSRKINGKIKNFKLHNIVRDSCVRQAGQEKFLVSVMDYARNPIVRRHFMPRILKTYPRISASWYDLDLKNSMHSSCTQTIICIPKKGYRPKGSVRDFSSLKVLHVLRRDDDSYHDLGQVFDLMDLTYLASKIPTSIVPPAVSKLQNLQTLIIYRFEVDLPVEIWRMPRLKHLIAFSFHPLPNPEVADPPLENLQTLSLATDFLFSRRMVDMIPNIRKLGVSYSGEKIEGGYHLYNLAHLHRLEKLKLEMPSSFCPSFPVFPQSLKKLNLSGSGRPWRDMRIIGKLPNLQVLKLRNYAFCGEHWETTAREFRDLRFLLIDESDLQYWTMNDNPLYLRFQSLKCLVLHRCPNLSEIPSDIGYFSPLQLIEVDEHNQSLLSSAKMIQKKLRNEVKDRTGNPGLQVRVKSF